MPADDELPERLASVLAVLYLAFNEGYLSSRPAEPFRRDLAEDATWLTEGLAGLMPQEPEPVGLLALMRLNLARSSARFDAAGRIVLLRDQDRARWDRVAISSAIALLERAAAMGRPGPYQVQAAISACHAEAETWELTDWVQVVVLYDLLLTMTPSPDRPAESGDRLAGGVRVPRPPLRPSSHSPARSTDTTCSTRHGPSC